MYYPRLGGSNNSSQEERNAYRYYVSRYLGVYVSRFGRGLRASDSIRRQSHSRGPNCPRRRRHGPRRIRPSHRQRAPRTGDAVERHSPRSRRKRTYADRAPRACGGDPAPLRAHQDHRNSGIGRRGGRGRSDFPARHRSGTAHAPDRIRSQSGLSACPHVR